VELGCLAKQGKTRRQSKAAASSASAGLCTHAPKQSAYVTVQRDNSRRCTKLPKDTYIPMLSFCVGKKHSSSIEIALLPEAAPAWSNVKPLIVLSIPHVWLERT
jgi:hypothetical protein